MNGSDKLLIRTARLDEAQAVFALKRLSFTDTTLPFTIYRASASIHYLENMIRTAGSSGANHIFVAIASDKVIGYYLVSQHNDTRFLNYIAVAPDFHGKGIGRALLAHFEAGGFQNGCSQYMLDAIQKNSTVLKWYLEQGYSPVGIYNHVRLRMRIPDRPTPKLSWDEKAWAVITTQEAEWGFAKWEASVPDGELEIGLIDGSVCKLLRWHGMRLETAINAVMTALADTRSELIISNLPNVPAELQCLQQLEVVRLLKKASR